MTALAFIAALVAAWVHFLLRGYFLWDGLTIYVAAFIIVLATACVGAVISRETRCILAALALIANFAASHYAWQSSNPILFCALKDVLTAGWFILIGVTRWEYAIGGAFLLSFLAGVLTQLGVIPDAGHRPDVYIAWNHADLTSILGHLASIALGIGAGDAGLVARDAIRIRPLGVSLAGWGFARLRALA